MTAQHFSRGTPQKDTETSRIHRFAGPSATAPATQNSHHTSAGQEPINFARHPHACHTGAITGTWRCRADRAGPVRQPMGKEPQVVPMLLRCRFPAAQLQLARIYSACVAWERGGGSFPQNPAALLHGILERLQKLVISQGPRVPSMCGWVAVGACRGGAALACWRRRAGRGCG